MEQQNDPIPPGHIPKCTAREMVGYDSRQYNNLLYDQYQNKKGACIKGQRMYTAGKPRYWVVDEASNLKFALNDYPRQLKLAEKHSKIAAKQKAMIELYRMRGWNV